MRRIRRLLMLIVLMALVVVGVIAYKVLGEGTESVDPLTYFDEFRAGQINMVYEGERIDWDQPVIEEEGVLYVAIEWANQYVDDRIFYDAQENIVTITNKREVMRMDLINHTVTLNNQVTDRILPIIQKGSRVYIGEAYLEAEYAFEIEKGKDGRLVVAHDTSTVKEVMRVKSKNTALRTLPHRKGLVVEQVPRNEELIVFGATDNGYLRVQSESGVIGFVAEKDVVAAGQTVEKQDKVYEPLPLAYPLNEKVNLVWDQMTVKTAGNWGATKYAPLASANVISPTWFEFADEEGNLIDRGHETYVAEAKARGLQVWALMSHNFAQPQYTEPILTSTQKRQHVINQLVAATTRYGIQGINIDIENVQKHFSNEWVQFMRELYPQLNARGITVSVDTYMPAAWSAYYEREKVSEVVDYFIVMAYDQHWGGSPQAGPTSGLIWVEEGIQLKLEEVPADKLVLGIPFFTRVWEEKGDTLTSKAYAMTEAAKLIERRGVTPTLDAEYGVPFASYTEGDTTYKVWLEDLDTMRKRVELIETYGLAGYAGWKLGLEDHAIWPILETVK